MAAPYDIAEVPVADRVQTDQFKSSTEPATISAQPTNITIGQRLRR